MNDYEIFLEQFVIKMNEFKKTDTYKKAIEAVKAITEEEYQEEFKRLNAIDWKKKAEEYHTLVAEGKLKTKQ